LAITGAPPLASIPYIATAAVRRRRAVRVIGWLAAIVGSLAAGAAVIHFFVMPLDILWFVLLQRIELVFFSIGHPIS
jgi:fatty acid desaturase